MTRNELKRLFRAHHESEIQRLAVRRWRRRMAGRTLSFTVLAVVFFSFGWLPAGLVLLAMIAHELKEH